MKANVERDNSGAPCWVLGKDEMKLSQKRRDALYAAIHSAIVDVRIELKLSPQDDVTLAQVEHEIWRKQKMALGLDDL